MKHMNDGQLLEAYATRNSEEAFRTLVDRYAGLVYHAALRQAGNPHTAQDVTQAVFLALAQKAGSIRSGTILSGWLFRATRFAFSNFVREESRRQRREQEAVLMESILRTDDPESVWDQIAPSLNDALDALSRTDREAILIRFFEDKSHREVAQRLGTSEDAAKVRISRALEKLRLIFAARGVTTPSAALSAALIAHAAQTPPAGLASAISAAALAKGTAMSSSASATAKGILKLMAWTKMKTAAVASVAILLVGSTTTIAVKQFRPPTVEEVFQHWSEDRYLERAPGVVLLRPSRYVNQGDWINALSGPPEKFAGRGRSFAEVLSTAYRIGPERMILPAGLPAGRFDFLAAVAKDPRAGLQDEIRKQFGVLAHTETRETDVLILRAADPAAPGLQVYRSKSTDYHCRSDTTRFVSEGLDMPFIAGELAGSYFGMPVIDETGLTGRYNFDLRWSRGLNPKDEKKEIARIVREQLGLELVPARRPVEMLVVERADEPGDEPMKAQASWSFAGYDTPEAGLQSVLWAMNAGDVKKFLAGLTPEFEKRFLSRAAKGKSESRIAADLTEQARQVGAFQFVSNEVVSADQSVVHFRSPRLGNASVMMRKIGSEWRMAEEPH